MITSTFYKDIYNPSKISHTLYSSVIGSDIKAVERIVAMKWLDISFRTDVASIMLKEGKKPVWSAQGIMKRSV